MLPKPIKSEIEAHLYDGIADVRAVAGGCISNASHVRTTGGKQFFLKWGDDPGMFRAEADALGVMRATETVRVPAVILVKEWLLAEWLEPGNISSSGWEDLGRNLAALHRHQKPEFGWPTSNYIGSLPQRNPSFKDWPSFWRDTRILAQADNLSGEHRHRIDRLLNHIDEELGAGNDEGPSLLHGDLWSGNVHGLQSGDASLVDPSCYYGHREVDLAMATLFGGLDARFYHAYAEAWPLAPGFERRRHWYQLYYMLVHVNLFGGAYLSGTMSLVGKLGF